MSLKKNIQTILREESKILGLSKNVFSESKEKSLSSLEKSVEHFLNTSIEDYDLPENFHKMAVDIYYNRWGALECNVTILFKKSFNILDSDKMYEIVGDIRNDIREYFGDIFSSISTGGSTIDGYNQFKWWYDERKTKRVNESEEKQSKYLNIIKNLIEPFKKEDCVCDIRVTFKDDMYMIYLVFGTEELNDLFFSFVGRAEYTRNLRNDVKNTIKDYLPINNLYVGSISKPNCEWSPLNESTFFIRRVDMGLINKEFFENLNLITSLYLRKYIDGIDFNFETFEDHVIHYFMDGYYNDLTNGGENDYPVDEVYEFLLNHFHKKIKDRYDTFFGRNINESENKKQSLLKTIEKEGLYNFIEMSGLDISQISSALKNMDNPKEVLKQYIRDFILINGHKWGDNSGILSGYEIEVSKNKYVDDIMVQDSDQIAVGILEFDIDEYGHTEQNDQYITTINNLTNEELLSIVAWMTETIKNGEWD